MRCGSDQLKLFVSSFRAAIIRILAGDPFAAIVSPSPKRPKTNNAVVGASSSSFYAKFDTTKSSSQIFQDDLQDS